MNSNEYIRMEATVPIDTDRQRKIRLDSIRLDS